MLEELIVTQLVKKFLFLLRNPMVHCRVQKRPPLDPILSQFTPSHPISSGFILILSSLRVVLLNGLFPSGLSPSILCSFSLYCAFYMPAILILLDLVTLMMFGEEYKLRNSSLYNLLQPRVTPS